MPELILGKSIKADFINEELEYREKFIYKCVCSEKIPKGGKISNIKSSAKRTPIGIDVRLSDLIINNFRVNRDLEPGTVITWADLYHDA